MNTTRSIDGSRSPQTATRKMLPSKFSLLPDGSDNVVSTFSRDLSSRLIVPKFVKIRLLIRRSLLRVKVPVLLITCEFSKPSRLMSLIISVPALLIVLVFWESIPMVSVPVLVFVKVPPTCRSLLISAVPELTKVDQFTKFWNDGTSACPRCSMCRDYQRSLYWSAWQQCSVYPCWNWTRQLSCPE